MDKLIKLILFSIFVVLLSSCTANTRAPVVDGWDKSSSKEDYYVVQKGDTLYSIAVAFNADMVELINANKLKPPYNLTVGQKIKLVKPKAVTPDFLSAKVTHWSWPAMGKVVQTFTETGYVGGKGIDIEGKTGEAVVASAAGKVIYKGSGLSSYGNLIIIKHNNTFSSLYANVKSMSVSEGQYVKEGQKIAEMGENSAGKSVLHFEIRKNKKPVDPMPYLKSAK
jgi:murein DD-endopeptidase MepM/ murein hydrolase activator NlpD